MVLFGILLTLVFTRWRVVVVVQILGQLFGRFSGVLSRARLLWNLTPTFILQGEKELRHHLRREARPFGWSDKKKDWLFPIGHAGEAGL